MQVIAIDVIMLKKTRLKLCFRSKTSPFADRDNIALVLQCRACSSKYDKVKCKVGLLFNFDITLQSYLAHIPC